MAQRRSRAALELAPGLRDRARPPRGRRRPARPAAPAGRRGSRRSRRRRGARRGRAARPPAAGRSPLETMSLPMKHDVAVADEVEPAQRARGRAGVAREGALAAVVLAGRPAARSGPRRPRRRRRAGGTRRRRRPAGPAACARAGRRPPSPPTATRPCGASRRAPRARRARPSRAQGRKRSGSRLTTYSSALPCTFTA